MLVEHHPEFSAYLASQRYLRALFGQSLDRISELFLCWTQDSFPRLT